MIEEVMMELNSKEWFKISLDRREKKGVFLVKGKDCTKAPWQEAT